VIGQTAGRAPDDYDAIIVGAGPAGLTAATYLARFRRRVLVLNHGPSRASWIPESHNTPGFSRGVGGPELLRRLTEQATQFGAEVRGAEVTSLTRQGERFGVSTAQGRLEAPHVVLATGVRDRLPALPGLEDAIRRSVVRMCPICDAYEAIDRRIAVLGDGELGAREAAFLRSYSEDVTLLRFPDGEAMAANPPPGEVIDVALADLSFTDKGVRVAKADEPAHTFDHLYLALGCVPQNSLAIDCGATHDDDGNLVVDAHQQTSVSGLYAAGDVVRGLNQIAVAAGEAAIAATAIHNRLRGVG
jgi:thioredoxin reductase (NADPH)